MCFFINEEFRVRRGWVEWDWLEDFYEEEMRGYLGYRDGIIDFFLGFWKIIYYFGLVGVLR